MSCAYGLAPFAPQSCNAGHLPPRFIKRDRLPPAYLNVYKARNLLFPTRTPFEMSAPERLYDIQHIAEKSTNFLKLLSLSS